MARFVRFMAGLFVLVHFALAASAAHAEKRIALVILPRPALRQRDHLNDDLHIVTLSPGLIASPPVEL